MKLDIENILEKLGRKKIAKVMEWVNALQLVCPYCDKIQIETTALHVLHSPPKYWICESCKNKMRVTARW